jgi:hypothetical protein
VATPAQDPVAEQLNFDELVGGRTPTGTTLSVTGVKLEDGKDYSKGQVVEIRLVAEIGAVSFRDKHDTATGQAVDCTRAHTARCVSAKVVRSLESIESAE